MSGFFSSSSSSVKTKVIQAAVTHLRSMRVCVQASYLVACAKLIETLNVEKRRLLMLITALRPMQDQLHNGH